MNIKNSFVFIQSIFKFAFTNSMVFTALFFYSIFTASAAAGTIVLDAPIQSCLITTRVVDLSWTSTLDGSPTYVILRKKVSEAVYAEIGATGNLTYQDNTALSDQNYKYQIKVNSIFSDNEVTVSANYCSAKFITPEVAEAECKNDGPRNNLAWIGATGTVSKYEIYRKNETAGDLVFSKIGETLPGVTVYSDGPGIIGTNIYIYFIRTVWQDTSTSDSEQHSIATLTCSPTLTVNSTCNTVSPGGPTMNLSWNNLLGVTEYKIYRDVNGSGSSPLVSIGPGVTTYTDNLISGLPVLYWENANIGYSVKAIWGVTDNKVSAEKVGAIMRCAPFLSVNSACDDFGNPAMNLSWTKTKGTEFYYSKYKDNTIYLGQQQSNILNEGGIEYLETVHVDNLTSAECPGGQCTHSYRVEAKIDAFTTLPSDNVSQDINCALNPPPSPPPVINTTSPSTHCETGKSIIDITWSSSDYTSYYTLYRTDQFGNTINSNTSATSFRDASIAGNTQYTYYLVAHGRGGASTGASKSIVSANCVVPFIPVLNPVTKACVSGNPKTSLSWSATANTINYDILRKISSDSSFSTVEPSYNLLAWDDSSVLPSTSYDYQIKAKGDIGVDPALSIVRSITTDSCAPAAPVVTLTNSCPGGGNNPKVNISWTVANLDNVISYEVYREGEASPISLVPKSSLSYSFDDPSSILSHGGTYNYKVVAIGYSGKKTLSSLVPITLYNCVLPGAFTLNPPASSCFESQPRVNLSWGDSTNVSTYNLLRARSSPATIVNVAFPYIESLRNSVSGNALQFDGVNDYIATNSFPIVNINNTITVSAWVYSSKKTNHQTIIADGAQSGTTGYLFLYRAANTDQLVWQFANGTSYYSLSSSSTFFTGFDNQWVLVTVVADYAGKNAKFYRNNEPVITTATTTNTMLYPTTNRVKYIGSYSPSMHFLNGKIDEVRLYNKALDSGQISNIYSGIFTDETNLIGFWRFDEGSGLIVSDSSLSGNNGTKKSSTEPAWSIREITPQTDYDWTVIANNLGGTTSSNTISSYKTPDCPPARPNLVFTPQCSANKAQMKLSWPYSINAAYYEIYRDGDVIPVYTINSNSVDPALRTWTDTNLGAYFVDGSTHTYKIKAITANDTKIDSEILTVNNSVCSVLPGPGNLNTEPMACSSNKPKMKLSWDSMAGASYYKVYRTGGSGTVVYSPVYTTPSGSITTYYENSNLDVSATYTYSVRAVSTGGIEGDSSVGIQYATGYCNPLAPSINGATSCDSYKPKNQITWTDTTSYNTNKYEIWRDTDSDINGALKIKEVFKTDTEFNLGTGTGSWYDYPVNPTPSLQDATDYFYWVKAVGFIGYSTATSVYKNVKTLFCAEITMPTSSISAVFSCSAANNPIITVSWAPVTGATSYSLYKGSSAPVAFYLNQTGTSYADNYNSVLVDTAYNYTVRGKNGGGQLGPESSSASTIPLLGNYCPPSKPAINPVATTCDSNVPSKPYNTISWTDATDFNTNKYKIYRNTVSDFGTATPIILDKSIPADFAAYNAKTWIHSDLTDNQDYFYWVQAIGPAGSSAESSSATKKTLPCAGLSDPVNLAVTSLVCSGNKPQARFSWNSVLGADSYTVYRYGGGTAFTPLTITDLFYNNSNLDVNTAYTYSVRARKGSIESSLVSAPEFITGYCAPVSPVLSPISTACVSNAPENTVSWTDSTSFNTNNYEIYRNTNPIPVQTVAVGTLSWMDNTILIPLTDYTYRIKAVGPAGSGYSNVQPVATYNCGTKPNTLTLDLAPGSPYCWNDNPYADFTWSNVPNAYSYNLYRSNISDSIQSSYSTVISPKTDSGSKAMQFDGVDDYVNMGVKPSFNLNILTIALWIKTPSSMGGVVYRNLVSKQGADRDYNFYAYSSDGTKVTSLHFSSARWGSSSFNLPIPFAPDTWHQVAITVNAAGLQKYYYDGNFLNQYSGIAATAGSAYPLWIGRADNYWKGLIDEVRIYNRDLSALEIADIYNGVHKNEIGLVGMWHFDEKSGTTVIDSSGTGNDGKIGGPEWVSGKENNALDFGGIDGYVNAGNEANLGLQTNFSIEAWIKPSVIKNMAIISKKDTTSYNAYLLWISSAGILNFYASSDGTSWGTQTNSTTAITANAWTHILVTQDSVAKLYINGLLVGQDATPITPLITLNPLVIGRRDSGNTYNFTGSIDEVRIYNRALSAAEVMEHNNGTFNNNTELRALWHFDEQSGTTAFDSSTFGNNATLIKNAAATRIVSSDNPAFSRVLEKNKSYSYYAKGIGSDMESDPSNTISFTTSTCEPKKPDPFEVNSQCDGASTQVLLSWPADIETSYWTVYKVGFPAFTKNITNNYYLDKDVASGASYQYKVEAFGKNGGSGIYSDTASVAIQTCYDVPVRPVAITSPDCAGVASKMIVDWSRASYGKIIAGDLGAIGSNKTMIVSTGVLNAINVGSSYKVYLETQTSPATISVAAKSSGDNSVTYDVVAALEGGNGTDTEASILSNTSIGNGTITAGNLSAIGFNRVMNTTPAVVSALVVGSLYKVNLPTQTSPATIKVMAKSSATAFTYNVVTPLLGGNGSDTNASIFLSKPLTLYDGSKTVSYNIYRKNITDGDPAYTNIFPNLPAAKREVLDGGVVADKEYSYIVEAIGSNETILTKSFLTSDSKAVSWNCANMPPFYPPDLSLNFTPYFKVSGGLVSLKWLDTQNETAYEIFRRVKGDIFFAYQEPSKAMQNSLIGFFIKSAKADYTNLLGGKQIIPSSLIPPPASYDYVDPAVDGYVYYNDPTVNEDIIYEYQVRALNGYGVTYSNIVSPVPVPIAPPGDFILNPGTLLAPKKLKLTWSEAAYTFKGGPVTYTLYKDSSDAFYSPTAVCANISERECIDSAASGLAKFYKVVAHNNGGDKSSNIISASATLKWREVIPK